MQKWTPAICCTVKEVFWSLLQRYGIWGDWENPYLTLNPDYEAAQVST